MATILEYKCPCCGGAIEFDSNLQKMKCPFCDTEFDVETLKGYDDVLKTQAADEMEWKDSTEETFDDAESDGLRIYVCNSCGGEIVGDENTIAMSCPFCDNPVVFSGKVSGMLKPNYVIPFKIDKKKATEALKNHFKGKILLPKAFKDENHIEEVKGLYVPFWLYDADADANIRYKATRVRTWSDSRYNYTQTSFYSVLRAGDIGFDKVPVDGSSKMPNDLMESIEPYKFSEATDFQTAYLAGYLADKYDVDAETCIERANSRIKKSTEDSFRSTVVGYTTVTQEHSGIRLMNQSKSYALFPVWMLNTKWKDQKFVFAVNGQTGKLVGNLPIDWQKFWLWFFGIFLGVSALTFFIVRLFS